MKTKWILFAAALVMIVVNLRDAFFSVYQQMSLTDLVPILIIVLISILIKTGVLSVALISIKKLWEWFRKK